jgi:hypothetical protein
MPDLPSAHKLKIALIYSFGANKAEIDGIVLIR